MTAIARQPVLAFALALSVLCAPRNVIA